MFSQKDFEIFKKDVEGILRDTFVQKPDRDEFQNNKYFFQRGLWSGTENNFYFYNKQKLASHKQKLLSMCKRIPKLHKPSKDHAGTISSFETLPPSEMFTSQSPENALYYFSLSNHFANLLCGSKIAQVNLFSHGGTTAFLIVLDSKYRSYFEKEGQEPADD